VSLSDIQLTLHRIGQSHRGTFGVLCNGEVPFALTLEEPWRDNENSISCIPAGFYVCLRVRSPKFGNTFEVTNVPNRSHILFHKGNTTDDTEGCILVGEEFSGTYDRPRISSSERGFLEFMQLLEGRQGFELVITERRG
jgi:hypothetical protein